MDNVIIVSSTEKGNTVLTDFLRSQSFTVAGTISSGSEARRAFLEQAPDLVIINAPLIDEFGHELAMNIAETHVCGIILVVKTDVAEDVEANVEDYGVVVVPKPINRAFFYHAVKMVLTARRRLMVLQTENVKLQQKIEEIRLVDRAKCCLIQYLNMTEAQAHRHIKKQAMDTRRTRREVAEGILQTYES